MQKEKFSLTGMSCASCQANITRAVSKLAGVEAVEVSLLAQEMSVTYDEREADTAKICATVAKLGYGIKPLASPAAAEGGDFRSQWQDRQERAAGEKRALGRRLVASLLLLLPLMYLAMGPMVGLPLPSLFQGPEKAFILALSQFLITLVIVVINRRFYLSGAKALWRKSPNMDTLVALGSGAALLYGVFVLYALAYYDTAAAGHYAHQLYFESCAMILTLVTVGKYMEARSKAKTSDALTKLVNLAPKTAIVLRQGKEVTISAQEVRAGDIVVIKPGASIPVDGVIVAGHSYVDQSAITGESIPVAKNVGDEVISATINKSGAFRFRAAKVGNDTTLAQIIRLVDEAGNSKAPIARLADKVSGIFVPVVLGVAILTAIVWLAVGQSFEFAFSLAIAVLVISCPCALGLATPVAIMVGAGKAAECGILLKSAASLEQLQAVTAIALDKTGTITQGQPQVTEIISLTPDLGEEELLTLAAGVEGDSEHPLSQAVREQAQAQGITAPLALDFQAHSGRGVSGTIQGQRCLAGNGAFLAEQGVVNVAAAVERGEALAAQGKTPLLLARDNKAVGLIAVADPIRPASRQAIGAFQDWGLRVALLTGDNPLTAQALQEELRLDEVAAGILPAEKEAWIRQSQAQGHKVAMVGDGVNDAPALARADIGIAIGAGTDIAIDSADVVLLKNSLADVVTAMELSHAVVRNIRQNLFWAFIYNILGIPLAAGVLWPLWGITLSPMLAAAAMSLSSLCVVTNALRLRFFRPQGGKEPASASAGEVTNNSQPVEPMEPVEAIKPSEPVESVNLIEPMGPIESVKPSEPTEAIEPVESMESVEPLEPVEPIKSVEPRLPEKGGNTMKKILTVEGMMCGHCQAHVTKALQAVAGVDAVEVDLAKKQATVTFSREVDDAALKAAVSDAGYEVTNCSLA